MAEHLYVGRPEAAANEGRKQATHCPCSLLLLIYEDQRIDDGSTVHALCPSCAAGWVWEVAWSDPQPSTPTVSPEGASYGLK